jgi:hypothetical protein
MKRLLVPIGLIILFLAEIFRVYFIMPFPGSQQSNTIGVAFFLNQYIFPIRLIALALVATGLWLRLANWRPWKKVVFVGLVLVYGFLFYMVNFKFLADKMFYQPRNKLMVMSAENKVGLDKLVLGVTINNDSRAYPIELIGYHHQVRDSIGGEQVMITYCTVCRTGRAYSPLINGKSENFRLVGMDHFNAMFEDNTTKSWWRQASGEAIAGKRKGFVLKELPSEQMRLAAWLERHPESKIMQPDPSFLKEYKGLEGFDLGILKSGLERRDTGSWKPKSWVIGINNSTVSKAYDWNELVQKRIIQDSVAGLPIMILIEKDNASFHAFHREIITSYFKGVQTTSGFYVAPEGVRDEVTHSLWNLNGLCVEGKLKGQQLPGVQAYQEFWHAWKTFHPNTTIYK